MSDENAVKFLAGIGAPIIHIISAGSCNIACFNYLNRLMVCFYSMAFPLMKDVAEPQASPEAVYTCQI